MKRQYILQRNGIMKIKQVRELYSYGLVYDFNAVMSDQTHQWHLDFKIDVDEGYKTLTNTHGYVKSYKKIDSVLKDIESITEGKFKVKRVVFEDIENA